MTDKEIIRVVYGCVEDNTCNGCPYNDEFFYDGCEVRLLRDLLKVTNRLQAEIKRLQNAKEMFDYLNKSVHFYEEDNVIYETDFKTPEAKNIEIDKKLQMLCDVKVCKAEAIKEFAERLKAEFLDDKQIVNMAWVNSINHIDNLVKEMVGEDNVD